MKKNKIMQKSTNLRKNHIPEVTNLFMKFLKTFKRKSGGEID